MERRKACDPKNFVILFLMAFFIGTISHGIAAERLASPAFTGPELVKQPREGWPTNGGNLYNQRFSPLTEINKTNVAKMRGVWRRHLNGSGIGPQYSGEAQPLVYQGVIYVITGADDVFALSVKTGEILWKYEAHLDPAISTVCCGWSSRGVGIDGDRVYVGQLDGKLVALDKKTGLVVWSVQAEKWQDGYTITSAPLYYNGLVISGFSGAERSTRGRLKAFDAKTGKLVWTFYTVPAPGEPGFETWPPKSEIWKYGGGNVWSTPSVDPELGLIFFGTSNPGADFNGSVRPGDNLYTNSVIALDVKTGKYRWHYQTVHHDLWDYSLANPTILYDVEIDGRERKALAIAGKTGWVYILDRVTGKPLVGIEERPVPQEPRQFTASTQPHPIGDSFVPQSVDIPPEGYKIQHGGRIFTPFWANGVVAKPSSLGGANWPPASVDPEAARIYVCANDKTHIFAGGDRHNDGWAPGKAFTGGVAIKPVEMPTGVFSALDLKTNRVVWQQRWKDMCYSGSAVTAAGLIFVGRGDGRLTALDTDEGNRLWEFQTDAGVNAPPTVFEYEGRQYVLVLSAGNVFARTSKGDSLWLFSLDGTLEPVEAPKVAAAAAPAAEDHAGGLSPKEIPIPKVMSGSERRDAADLYGRSCAGCHGVSGEGTGNGIPLSDARDPTKSAPIIRDGREEMPAFGDDLSPAEIGQIAAYVATLRQTAAKR